MPYTFRPILKPTLWGGSRLATFKGMPEPADGIGESWEISGVPGSESVVAGDGPDAGLTLPQLIARHGAALMGHGPFSRHGCRFPLLVKFIDAARDLSLQVHPADAQAVERHGADASGKTEMYYIIDAAPGARIWAGMREGLAHGELHRLAATGEIMERVCSWEPKPGDVFFIPAGTVHAIGAGVLLAEIQQTSDITYRIFDHNRVQADGKPRQLHLDEAADAIAFHGPYPGPVADAASDDSAATPVTLLSCDHFRASRLTLGRDDSVTLDRSRADAFLIAMCLTGSCTITPKGSGSPLRLSRGSSALIEAACPAVTIADGPATILFAEP